ncbi:unnamed protein product [Blepharisma stoltei]|uniref:Uncharacterized protein n=1 Tax=Blepharisma stoltei TaxID=1481888 RepID=A0AAU9JL63_9CILI|nr:unnamed protein product [Blepharisma stoltei]
MMTILEEEDSESFDSNQGTQENRMTTKVAQLRLEDSLSGDTSEDPEKATTDSISRQDSIKSWHEFKSEDSRRDSFGKPVKPNNIEFPSLVKGLDLEGNHFQHKDSGSSRGGSMGSEGSKTSLAMARAEVNAMMDASEKADRLSDLDEVTGRLSFYSLDESMVSTIGLGGAASPMIMKRTTLEMTDTWNKIIQSDEHDDPEGLLLAAIGKGPAEENSSKPSFWEKIGLKDSKDREHQWYALAVEEWHRVEAEVKRLKLDNESLAIEIKQLDAKVVAATQNTNELEEKSFQVKKKIIDEKMQLELKLEAKNSEIDEAFRTQEDLLQRLQELKDNYILRDIEEEEREERWIMRIQDLRSHLIIIMDERTQAEAECLKNQELLEVMESERSEQNCLNEQIEICIELLNESMEFFTQSNRHLNFTAEFCEVLKNLREATFEAIEAEKEFKRDALTDPRTIMPYSRQSEFLPGASTRIEK